MFDGELVVLDLDRGEYYALDAIGAKLWDGIQRGQTLDEIADEIVTEYDVKREKLLVDLNELCNTLVAHGLFLYEPA